MAHINLNRSVILTVQNISYRTHPLRKVFPSIIITWCYGGKQGMCRRFTHLVVKCFLRRANFLCKLIDCQLQENMGTLFWIYGARRPTYYEHAFVYSENVKIATRECFLSLIRRWKFTFSSHSRTTWNQFPKRLAFAGQKRDARKQPQETTEAIQYF